MVMLLDRLRIADVGPIGANGGAPMDLRLARGVNVLVGPNGAGKSTVLHALALALQPASHPFEPDDDLPWGCEAPRPHIALTWVPAGTTTDSPHAATTTVVRPAAPSPASDDSTLPQLVFVPAEFGRRQAIEQLIEQFGATTPPAHEDPSQQKHPSQRMSTPELLCTLVSVLHDRAAPGDRALLVAIDQPDTGLHPGAQQQLATDLHDLAACPGVTVIITTHSPFVIPRHGSTRVFEIGLIDGGSACTSTASGDRPLASLIDTLFDDRGIADLLDQAALVPSGAAGIVVVEGDTDAAYLQLSAHLGGQDELVDDLHIAVAHGTRRLVLDTLVLRTAAGDRPVCALVDHDDEGRRAAHVLTGRLGLRNRTEVVSVAEVFPEQWRGHHWDAEDLLPPELLERFVAEHGENGTLKGKYLRPDGAWHWDLTTDAKGKLPAWLQSHATGDDLALWHELLVLLRQRMGLPTRP